MRPRDRRAEMRSILRSRPVGVDELAERYDVSLSTVRRDLATLSADGDVVRTYGGALAPAPGEQSLHEREHLALAQKAAISREAERFVEPRGLLLLDAGTTVGALAASRRTSGSRWSPTGSRPSTPSRTLPVSSWWCSVAACDTSAWAWWDRCQRRR